MKVILTLLLVLIAVAMIFISFKSGIPAPGLTGLGFIIIAALFYLNTKK
ncbi:hypothetical protein [Paucihalobacter sp.]